MNLKELFRGTNGETSQNIAWTYTRLKECYELMDSSAQSIEVRTLSRKRLSNLHEIGAGLPEEDTFSSIDSVQSSLSLIRTALASEDVKTSTSASFSQQTKINSLPESSEKNYLLALLALRGDTGNQGCLNALRFLERAIGEEPSNIIYRTLAEAIHRAVD